MTITGVSSSRSAWAEKLLDAVDVGKVPKGSMPQDVLGKIKTYKEKAIVEMVHKHWGGERVATTAEMQEQIRHYAAVVQSGSGAISALSALPLPFTLLPAQSQALSFTIAWPSTAVRVGFTVNFAANNGAYTGTSTFYVLR